MFYIRFTWHGKSMTLWCDNSKIWYSWKQIKNFQKGKRVKDLRVNIYITICSASTSISKSMASCEFWVIFCLKRKRLNSSLIIVLLSGSFLKEKLYQDENKSELMPDSIMDGSSSMRVRKDPPESFWDNSSCLLQFWEFSINLCKYHWHEVAQLLTTVVLLYKL